MHQRLLADLEFIAGRFDTTFVNRFDARPERVRATDDEEHAQDDRAGACRLMALFVIRSSAWFGFQFERYSDTRSIRRAFLTRR